MQVAGVATLPAGVASAQRSSGQWPPALGPNTPKICLGAPPNADEAVMRRYKQIGVDYVLMGGPRSPWEEAELRERMDRYKGAGIAIINMMIGGIDDVIWGRPGADAQIENVIKSIRVAGKVGLPVIEYNFYAHRLMEGYKEELGRGGAGIDGIRLRVIQESSASRERRHTYSRTAVETCGALSESCGAGSREGRSAAGTASERSSGSAESRVGAIDGHVRALERIHQPGEESA